MAEKGFPLYSFPTYTWPKYTWPGVYDWGFGEIWRATVTMNRTVSESAVMNRQAAETVNMTRVVSDIYSEVEDL